MKMKLIAATAVALLAGGLASCSTPIGYPYSATDCRYPAPMPRNWVPNGSEGCEHYVPYARGHKYYRHYRHVRHVHHVYHPAPHPVYKP